MGDVKTVVYRFPEIVDKFLKQATETMHDLDTLQPGSTLGAVEEFVNSLHEESKLRIQLLTLQLKNATAQESFNTQLPNELKEVKQIVSAMSGALKGADKRLKNLEAQRTEKPEGVVPPKWGSKQPHNNRRSETERGNKNSAIPQLPPLNKMQPQHATEVIGDALHIEGAVKREEIEAKGTAEVRPFNSSLSNQISTKVKAVGT